MEFNSDILRTKELEEGLSEMLDTYLEYAEEVLSNVTIKNGELVMMR